MIFTRTHLLAIEMMGRNKRNAAQWERSLIVLKRNEQFRVLGCPGDAVPILLHPQQRFGIANNSEDAHGSGHLPEAGETQAQMRSCILESHDEKQVEGNRHTSMEKHFTVQERVQLVMKT